MIRHSEEPVGSTRLLTISQAADALGCSEANIYALIDAGELPFVPIGRRKGYRIDTADISAFIDRRKQQKSGTAPRPARPRLKHIRLS
ncbi:MAG: helix-turn-helix domain-containing protein [Planctomycetaceae bacterium]